MVDTSTQQMVAWLRALNAAKHELAELEERGKEHLAQVKADIEADLAPARRRVEDLSATIKQFIEQENNGEKYRVPGLGTAFVQRRQNVKITDLDAFAAFAREAYADREDMWVKNIHGPTARKVATETLMEHGELLPGTDLEKSETLVVRESQAQVAEIGG